MLDVKYVVFRSQEPYLRLQSTDDLIYIKVILVFKVTYNDDQMVAINAVHSTSLGKLLLSPLPAACSLPEY